MRGHGTLVDLFANHRSRSDPFCYFWKGDVEEKVSFEDFFLNADRYTQAYGQEGLAKGSLVVLATDYSMEGLYAFVGAIIGGFIPAFLAPFTSKQNIDAFTRTLNALIEVVQPAALVVSSDLNLSLDTASLKILLATSDLGRSVYDGPADWLEPEQTDIAFMQFSSGTTGLRKGVMLSHRAIVAQIAALSRVIQFDADSLVASWLPVYHDMGLISSFILPLASGIPIALQDPVEWSGNPARLFAAIERHRASHCWLPNFAFNHLRLTVPTDAAFDLSSMKAFINCSEPCKASTFDAFMTRFRDLGVTHNMLATSYAMAESVFAVTQSPLGRQPRRLQSNQHDTSADEGLVASPSKEQLLSTGHVLDGLRLEVLDAKGQPLADGIIGRIALAGDFLFQGYNRNPDATDQAFQDGWFMTGDLGLRDDNEIFVTGREKDIIIVNGRNFYSHDIEAIVSTVAGVKAGRAVAFAGENRLIGSEEVIVVAETEIGADDYRTLAGAIKQRITSDLSLTAVRVHPVPLRWLIKTTSGKISRVENQRKYEDERDRSHDRSCVLRRGDF